MKANQLKSYRFATEAQWNSCLFVQTDFESLVKGKGIRPFAPYARPATLYRSPGAYSPAVTETGEILWRDDHGGLHWLSTCDYAPEKFCALSLIAKAKRIVPTRSGLWVIGEPTDVIELYEDDTLTRLLVVERHGAIAEMGFVAHGRPYRPLGADATAGKRPVRLLRRVL